MKRKILSTLLSAAMLAALVAGCGSDSGTGAGSDTGSDAVGSAAESAVASEASASAESEAAEEKPYDGVTLTMMIETGTAPETYEPVLELIKEKMGINIEVELRPAGSEGTNLIRTRLASGDMTDLQIYNVGALLATLNPTEYFIDMSDSDVAATFDASFTSAATVDGGLYAVPAGSSSGGGVMYNKDIYEEYNLEVPETWDEFIANLDVLKDAGEVALIGSFADAWTAQVPFLADNYQVLHDDPDFAEDFTAGEKKFSTSEAAFRSWEKLEATQPYYNDDYLATTYDDACDMLAMGEGAHYIMTTGALTNIYTLYGEEVVNRIGVFPIPGDTPEQTGLTVWASGGLYGNKNSENVDAVKAVMEFWVSDEALDVAVANSLPVGPFHNGYELPDNVFEGVKDQVKYFEEGKTAPALEYLTAVKGANCDKICQELVTGQTTAEEAAAAYDEDCIKMAVQLGLDWE